MLTVKKVPRTRVLPGDTAHHFAGHDSRIVARVEGQNIWIIIGSLKDVGPCPITNYTFTRIEETP